MHGDDEGSVETGFHLVQGDGAQARMFGENAVDTVFDSIYHIGFQIVGGRFVNEDGDANASVGDVAYWLDTLLRDDLAAGSLANPAVDPLVHGKTGTGLDALVSAITGDAGLNDNLSRAQINAGATAADGMNALIVQGIRATGIADDGDLTALDLRDLNGWIRRGHLAEWTALHGDDEGGIETGFHLVQGDGATGYLYDERTVDTLADGLYHLGFQIQWDRFVNEDGNGNAALEDAATWLSLLLADDLAAGTLDSGRGPVDPVRFAANIGYRVARDVVVDAGAGQLEAGRPAALRDTDGTFALRFTADTPDDGSYQVLFSKDGSSNVAGDLSVYLHDGQLTVTMQDGTDATWLTVGDYRIEAGQSYDLAVSFGRGGLEVFLNGKKVAVDDAWTTGLDGNGRALVIGAGTWGRNASDPDATWNHFDGTIEGFTFYDRALTAFEIAGLAHSAPLDLPQPGAPEIADALPAVRAGTGLLGEVFDRTGSFSGIDDLIAQTVTDAAPTRTFAAARVDFGAASGETTLGQFLGDAGTLDGGAGTGTDMTTIGLHLSGYVWIPAGTHIVTVRSDDGFLLDLGGTTISTSGGRGFEGTSRQIDFTGGLYAIDLYYYENMGDQGLRLELDGTAIGPEHFYRTAADFQAALDASGPMPDGGLPPVYDGPVGTTGTGLDAVIAAIGSDDGLAHTVSAADVDGGAAAADLINGLIVEAIHATGAADDGTITVSETYDLSDWIRGHHYAAFVAAHGDDESGSETGYHLVQNDGATARLFGENAVNTVFDGLYHIGFQTIWDRFANEDGNANARVETVAFWLNTLLADDLAEGSLGSTNPAPGWLLGSAAQPFVRSDQALTSRLAYGAQTLTLTGTARNGIGSAGDNTLTGNGLDNLFDGGRGDDTLIGGAGNDILIGGVGADLLNGGRGDDTYVVDQAGDRIETMGDALLGRDTVTVTGALLSWRLAEGIETLISLVGADFVAIGNDAANLVQTGRGADRLTGGLGNDTLDGGFGGDRMLGGAGNDTYIVDHADDRAIDLAGEGVDTVLSSVRFVLGCRDRTACADRHAGGGRCGQRARQPDRGQPRRQPAGRAGRGRYHDRRRRRRHLLRRRRRRSGGGTVDGRHRYRALFGQPYLASLGRKPGADRGCRDQRHRQPGRECPARQRRRQPAVGRGGRRYARWLRRGRHPDRRGGRRFLYRRSDRRPRGRSSRRRARHGARPAVLDLGRKPGTAAADWHRRPLRHRQRAGQRDPGQ